MASAREGPVEADSAQQVLGLADFVEQEVAQEAVAYLLPDTTTGKLFVQRS